MTKTSAPVYSPALLRVDLTTGAIARDEVDAITARRCLGGVALGAKYLYDEVPAGTPWSDPANKLMLLTGPLTGSPLAGSGGFNVTTIGAMTGGAAQTQAQGSFGAFLRYTGYSGLVLQGAAPSWLYLLVDESGRAELRDARHLIGLDTWQTVDALCAELGKTEKELSVACIGPAGEHLVRWAAIVSDKGHVAGHNGVGAIMGSKRLKAVVVLRARNSVLFADRPSLAALAKKMIEPVIARPGGIHTHGTLNGVHSNYKTGNLPVRNYQTAVWDISDEDFATFSGKHFHDHFQPRRPPKVCWACSNHHCQMITLSDGPYAGMVVEEPEYEQLSAFSANLGINDVTAATMLGSTVDRLGLDTNEGGWVLSCVYECFERGILTKADLDGLEPVWGNAEAGKTLLGMIARREGIGDVLAEGVRLAVGRIGRGAERVGVYTRKGSTPRGHDHRARWSELFDTSVSESGALDNTLAVADLTVFGLPAKVSPFDPDFIARAEAKMKGGMQFEDSMVTCRFNSRGDIALLAQAASAATGWEITVEEAMTIGRRAVNTMRALNLRNGLDAEMDRPGPRYGSTQPDGPAAGMSISPHYDSMLATYYELMGWDRRGVPLPATLEALGLDSISADLQPVRAGK